MGYLRGRESSGASRKAFVIRVVGVAGRPLETEAVTQAEGKGVPTKSPGAPRARSGGLQGRGEKILWGMREGTEEYRCGK